MSNQLFRFHFGLLKFINRDIFKIINFLFYLKTIRFHNIIIKFVNSVAHLKELKNTKVFCIKSSKLLLSSSQVRCEKNRRTTFN